MRNLIKHKMLDLNRDDFVNYLSVLLNCTRQTAGNKLSGKSEFTESDIKILVRELKITPEELGEVFT